MNMVIVLAAATLPAVIDIHGPTPACSCAEQSAESGGASFYEKALEELNKSKPVALQAEVEAAAKAAGRAAVREGFRTGKVVTANTGEKYPDYYGDAWDKKHGTWKPGIASGHSARHEGSGTESRPSSGESKSERKAA